VIGSGSFGIFFSVKRHYRVCFWSYW